MPNPHRNEKTQTGAKSLVEATLYTDESVDGPTIATQYTALRAVLQNANSSQTFSLAKRERGGVVSTRN